MLVQRVKRTRLSSHPLHPSHQPLHTSCPLHLFYLLISLHTLLTSLVPFSLAFTPFSSAFAPFSPALHPSHQLLHHSHQSSHPFHQPSHLSDQPLHPSHVLTSLCTLQTPSHPLYPFYTDVTVSKAKPQIIGFSQWTTTYSLWEYTGYKRWGENSKGEKGAKVGGKVRRVWRLVRRYKGWEWCKGCWEGAKGVKGANGVWRQSKLGFWVLTTSECKKFK